MSHNHFIQNKSKTPSRKTMGRAAVMVVAMVVTLIFCSVTAFAWFSANVANTGNTITTGDYQISVEIGKDSDSLVFTHPSAQLLEAGTYTVRLNASGTVTTGYCKIQIDDDVYYTEQLSPGTSMTFTLNLDSRYVCSFTACWGTYSGTENVIQDQGTIGTPAVGNSIMNAAPTKPDESTVSEEPESNESEETVPPEKETPSQPVESEPVVSEPETSTESTVVSDSSEETGSQDAEEGNAVDDTNEETVEQPEETEPVASVGE